MITKHNKFLSHDTQPPLPITTIENNKDLNTDKSYPSKKKMRQIWSVRL